MDAFAYSRAVVAPAFPALGRTTRDGLHRLRGRPVHETEIGRDPKTPVRESHLVSLLQTQSRRTAAVVTLDTVECGPRAIREQVEAHVRRGAALLVCDAEDDAALARGQDCALVIIGQPVRVELAPRIVDVLGRLVADCARSHRLRGFILTGGDTARAVCRHLGVAGVQLLAEIEPGVPLGRVVGQTSSPLLAVTKAGAFGSEQTLVHALHQLKGDS